MTNSFDKLLQVVRDVVNCFQISNFVLWQTAPLHEPKPEEVLWIAFKLVTLSYDKQLDSSYNKEINKL